MDWSSRHGISARGENDSFWAFLIPGVGRAPVGGFQVLIVLFVLLIGPLNYVVLRRRRQLYLLIATVPIVATAITLLLIGYAVAADGFSLRVRVRSVTLLDQVRGESVSWSRISYYAGLAPSGGLRFSPDTAVLPIDQPGRPSWHRSVDWTETQRLTTGWVPSRTPTQLLAIHYREGSEHLAVASGDTDVLRLTNNLDVHIRKLILAGEPGLFYTADDLAPQASQRVEPVELGDVLPPVGRLVGAQVLEAPFDLNERDFSGGPFGRRRFLFGWSGQPVDWSTSVIESILRVLKEGSQSSIQELLRPGSFVAITERPPHVDLGVADAEEVESLYVIVGKW
jgi:hypothetical protein